MKNKILNYATLLLVVLLPLLSACGSKEADGKLLDRLEALENRAARLEDRCKRLNSNIATLRGLASVSGEYDRVIGIDDLIEDGAIVGYTIHFAFHDPLKLYLARDGKDGIDGKDGKNGQNGADGNVPTVGIEVVQGVRYWTLDGQPLLDAAGNRIPLVVSGSSVVDGVTPRLKIENGKWYYSLDEGATWTVYDIEVRYGDGNLFSSVVAEGEEVVFTLSTGEQIRLPRQLPLSLSVTPSSQLQVSSTAQLSYVVTSDAAVEVSAYAEGDWRAVVAAPTAKTGTVTVTAPASGGTSKVTVIATDASGQSVYVVINCVAL
ncbi:MAG: hypothetical protein IJR34_04205 [Bacteroidales bacterium]|nr:hypothetical protein [Bacteroidales bacterium]MBQ9597435.1 hypothetical protein [Bacteroidales bacterium]